MLDELNERFGCGGAVEFGAGSGGLPRARVRTGLCTGEIYLHGAHVTSYRPNGHEDLLWVSPTSRFLAGKPIRGGIPLCWPWFGDDPAGRGRPAHGFARTHTFEVLRAEIGREGDCVILLGLQPSESTRALWPEDFELTLQVKFGATLEVQLGMRNTASQTGIYTAALHTYLRVADVGKVTIHGLTGSGYLDKVQGFARCVQEAAPTIDGEVDRVYLGTTETTEIHDPGLGRILYVAKAGSRTTVLWNPGAERARSMEDLDEEGAHEMLCVEAANAFEDGIVLGPGETHELSTMLSVGSVL